MPKKFDVVATTGEYEKDGQSKRKYANVGMVIEKDGKFYLKLTHPVTVDDNGQVVNFFNLFEPTPRNTAPAPPPPAPADDPDDDIPW